MMNLACHVAAGREGLFRSQARSQAKEILRRLEAGLIALTDCLFNGLDRDRSRRALGRLDDRALRDLGLSPADRDGV